MKLGILSFAHLHAGSYAHSIQQAEGAELDFIWDENPARGQQAAASFGVPYIANLADALARDAQAIVIDSSNARHAGLAIAAAEAGKHVLCEKPLATTVEDGKAMIDACAKAGVKLMTAFPCRFHPAYEGLCEVVTSGKLGAVKAIVGTNRGSMIGDWFCVKEESGGGAVMDHTVHVVDLIRAMTGSNVAEVYAEYDEKLYTEYGIDDIGLLSMQLENGVIATLDCSWSRPPGYPTWGDVTIEVVGEAGVTKMDMFAQDLAKYPKQATKSEWVYWGDDMDFLLIQGFISAITENKEPLTSGQDGLEALKVALAAYESGARKQPVVLKELFG